MRELWPFCRNVSNLGTGSAFSFSPEVSLGSRFFNFKLSMDFGSGLRLHALDLLFLATTQNTPNDAKEIPIDSSLAAFSVFESMGIDRYKASIPIDSFSFLHSVVVSMGIDGNRYVLPSTDDTEAVLIKHTDEVIWDIESIQSSEKKVDMPPERYSEYVPMFYGVYEEHDRGPQSSNKSKFLEPHNGLNSILRLTKRHTDAILDKRIVKEEWGASLSNTLPSSFCFKVLIDGIMDSQ
ncbi:hypothetical protein CASFOL_014130 [Castilleja foliolosa]|uniref:Uncharacterized protein n=1 Tax=Castilleja foliolosa TaxID=1961234 RepID=A0ABD3DR26_9LAMI